MSQVVKCLPASIKSSVQTPVPQKKKFCFLPLDSLDNLRAY
jgi:hypothetical protein